jgi:hypothetical protein
LAEPGEEKISLRLLFTGRLIFEIVGIHIKNAITFQLQNLNFGPT